MRVLQIGLLYRFRYNNESEYLRTKYKIYLKFQTQIIILTYYIFVYTIYMFLVLGCIKKCFSTVFTFVIFYTFMNTTNVFSKISIIAKRFSTGDTNMIFQSFMNTIYMSFQITRLTECFFTRGTFVSLWFNGRFLSFMNNSNMFS